MGAPRLYSASATPFVNTTVNGKYVVKLPKFLSMWDAWGGWEAVRFNDMELRLKKGDILFDVGAEVGSISAIYAQWVGGENMVLFEPEPYNWPNIRRTWEENGLRAPMYCFCGLVGETTKPESLSKEIFPDAHDWPLTTRGDDLVGQLSYRYLHEHGEHTPTISIDDFCGKYADVHPNAITIDVEGAELEVLRGCVATLREDSPIIWVSIHPDLGEKHYKHMLPGDILRFMDGVGYIGTFLGIDHEEHWRFDPK